MSTAAAPLQPTGSSRPAGRSRSVTGASADASVSGAVVRTGPVALVAPAAPDLVLFADFTDPYAYLAELRLERLLGAGSPSLQWCSVISEGVQVTSRRPSADEQEARDRALADVLSRVGPHEQLTPRRLPDRTPALIPNTGAATAAYAEACGVGAGDVARRLIFAAYWVDGLDIGNAGVLRALLMGPVREAISRWAYGISGHRPPMHPEPSMGVWAPAPRAQRAAQAWRGDAEVVTWAGNTVSVVGGPITATGDRRVRQWQRDWRALGVDRGLTAVTDGKMLRGAEVVDHLALPDAAAPTARIGVDAVSS